MADERRLYINQLLRQYKTANEFDSTAFHLVEYRLENDTQNRFRYFSHNDGIEFVIQYIKELETKIDELQYIEKIVQLANKNVQE